MRIELRDSSRQKLGRAEVDPAQRPTRVVLEAPSSRGSASPPREAFLTWDGAIDDAGRLRRCLSCGSTDLFREKAFPQVTGVVVVLAFAGAAAGAFGLAQNPYVIITMAVVLVLDVAILVLSRRRLVCYRCRTSYHRLEIARYHKSWERATAERYPPPPPPPPQSAQSATPHGTHASDSRAPITPSPAPLRERGSPA